MSPLEIVGIVVLAVIAVFVMLAFVASFYQKAGPNEALIISGGRKRTLEGEPIGFRIIKGGGTVVWPVIEKAQRLSLELMSLDINMEAQNFPPIYTKSGIPIRVDAVAQIKVKGDEISIATAAERFLTYGQNLSDEKSPVRKILLDTLTGHLRGMLGGIEVEQILHEQDSLAAEVARVSSSDLSKMGLTVDTFAIKSIIDVKWRDSEMGYLEALGKPRVAQITRDALIAQAEMTRDSKIRQALANQEAEKQRLLSETSIAQAERDKNLQVASFTAAVNKQRAQAELAYDLQRNLSDQDVKRAAVQVTAAQKEEEIKVQQLEIQRKQAELETMVIRPSLAERDRITNLAEAERQRLSTTAMGQAEAARAIGEAEAAAERAKGLAQADVTKAQGASEAEVMQLRAAAFKLYNDAAVTQMIIDKLPEIVRAIAEPLSKTERIVLIGGQGGFGGGASGPVSSFAGDLMNVLTTIAPQLEAVTGVDIAAITKSRLTPVAPAEHNGSQPAEIILPEKN